MNRADETHTTSQPIAETGSDSNNDHNRQQTAQQLYFRPHNHSAVLEIVQADPSLTIIDHGLILDGFEKRFSEYDGPAEDAIFLGWAEDLLRPAVQFYAILRDYKGAIYGGIWDGLGLGSQQPNFFDDDKALVEDIFQEVSWLIFLLVDGLLTLGTAKLSSRVFALAKKHTLDYHTKKLRRRYTLGKTYPTSIQECELFSEMELASMAEDAAEESIA